jgi:hypothetical protein
MASRDADAGSDANVDTAVVRDRYDRGAGRNDFVTWPMEVMAVDRFRGRLIAEVQGPRVLEVGGLAEIRRVLRPTGHALFLEHMRPGTPWLARVFDWLDPLVARSGPISIGGQWRTSSPRAWWWNARRT